MAARLRKDPRELKNVYTDRAYAGTMKKMKAELVRLRKELDDRDQFAEELSNKAKFQEVPLKPVLLYDFERVMDGKVTDISGKGNGGQLSGGEIVAGRRGWALQLERKGNVAVAGRLDSSMKAFTVGAWCKPIAADGVVASQGGGSHGFALYVQDGLPRFAVRSKGGLTVVSGKESLAIGHWVHLMGLLSARGELLLRVDGKPVGMAKGGAIAAKPFDRMEVGDDSSNHVADYSATTGWRGLIEDVRLYWGELEVEKIETWAGR